jgi:hypothetical protein
MWHKLKLEKPNIATEVILKPNVATMVETHSKLNITTIKLDNQMAVIQVQVEKNILQDVLLDGGTSVNIIIKNLKRKLGLLKPRPFPYHLRMANKNMTRPLGIIRNLKILIYGIPYIATFNVLKNNVVDFSYSMLMGRLWLKDAKVTHDLR